MNTFFIIYSAISISLTMGIDVKDDIWNQFIEFQTKFNKKYETLEDLKYRYEIFTTNLHDIIAHNLNPYRNFSMNINKFADITSTEFKNNYIGGFKKLSKSSQSFGCKLFTSYPNKNDPEAIDWTEKNVVNAIRDQESCGSCWAFATTANAESVWAISTGELLDLSEQFLVDCATGIGYFNQGCNGGQPDSALKYMINNGVCSELMYPYTATTDKCQKCSINTDVKFTSCYDVTPNNQLVLKAAVAQNPVVVAIEADTKYFQFYSSGVLTDSIKCGTNLDHAVEIIGYGKENDIDYWKVRNSWGTSWGENGYVKIQRTSSTSDAGVCGIAMEPSFIHL